MATGVGLRIAEDNCTAAIVTDNGEPQYIVRESILHMYDDGDTTLGGAAPSANSHSITGFASAIGDPAGISVDDGEGYRAEDLVATALFCLINLAAEHLSGPAEFYATYPADWPSAYVHALREALDYLGLRSVLLVSEGDLPGSDSVEPGKSYAYDAARAALAAVLATPAGATPPDPTTDDENSTVVTDIIPAVPAVDTTPKAYSAAIPVAVPFLTDQSAGAATIAPPTAVAATDDAAKKRGTPILIAAAVAIGLVLGGFGIAVLFRDTSVTPVPTVRDAKSDSVSVTPTPQPPVNLAPEPAPAPPPVVITTTVEPEPEPTTTPPTTTTEPTTTLTVPTTTRPSPTTTTRKPFFPPSWTNPGWDEPWDERFPFDYSYPR